MTTRKRKPPVPGFIVRPNNPSMRYWYATCQLTNPERWGTCPFYVRDLTEDAVVYYALRHKRLEHDA